VGNAAVARWKLSTAKARVTTEVSIDAGHARADDTYGTKPRHGDAHQRRVPDPSRIAEPAAAVMAGRPGAAPATSRASRGDALDRRMQVDRCQVLREAALQDRNVRAGLASVSHFGRRGRVAAQRLRQESLCAPNRLRALGDVVARGLRMWLARG